jgi:hypothetical protein
MKTNYILLIFITLASILMPTNLRASDNQFHLGGEANNSSGIPMLDIRIYPGGCFDVMKKINGTYEIPSFFAHHMFALKIGDKTFTSVSNSMFPSAGIGTYNTDLITFQTIEDVPSRTNISGTDQYVTKKFTGIYEILDEFDMVINSYTFYVYSTIRYNKNDPDKIMMTTEIDAANIPTGTNISLGYGVYAMPNNFQYGWAITFPDIMRNSIYLNNSNPPTSTDHALTQQEVRSLSMIGIINYAYNGDLLGYYPADGRRFDRAHSGRDLGIHTSPENYTDDFWIKFLRNNMPNNVNYYRNTPDPSLVVAYDGISAGETTIVQTGVIFASMVPIDLDYTWQNNTTGDHAKDLAVPIGTSVSLRLAANNYNTEIINDVGFLVNMPAGFPIVGTPTNTGFVTPPTAPTNGITSYQITNGRLPALTNGIVLASVSTATYGQWIIDHTMIPTANLSNIIPLTGTMPAVLTVTTEVNYDPAPSGNVSIAPGTNETFYIKLPTGVAAPDRNVEVYLECTGTTGSFSTIPSSVTMYSGNNYAILSVIANPGAQVGHSITIKLTGTDYAPFRIGEDDELTLVIPEIHYIPVNPHLMSKIIIP